MQGYQPQPAGNDRSENPHRNSGAQEFVSTVWSYIIARWRVPSPWSSLSNFFGVFILHCTSSFLVSLLCLYLSHRFCFILYDSNWVTSSLSGWNSSELNGCHVCEYVKTVTAWERHNTPHLASQHTHNHMPQFIIHYLDLSRIKQEGQTSVLPSVWRDNAIGEFRKIRKYTEVAHLRRCSSTFCAETDCRGLYYGLEVNVHTFLALTLVVVQFPSHVSVALHPGVNPQCALGRMKCYLRV